MDSYGLLADQCPPNLTELIGLVPMDQKGCFFLALSSRCPRINHLGSVGPKARYMDSERYRFPLDKRWITVMPFEKMFSDGGAQTGPSGRGGGEKSPFQ